MMDYVSMRIGTRAAEITATDKSTVISIATWLLAVVFLIMYLSREAIKFVVLRKVQIDDYLITAATVFALGLSVTTSMGASKGLGEDATLILTEDFEGIQKVQYAGELLYIASLCCAKLSLVAFFDGLGVNRSQRRGIRGLGLFIIVWSFLFLIAAIFQCGVPKPWQIFTSHCFDRSAFWTVYGTIDIATDLCVVMLSVLIVYDLHVKLLRKLAVFGCFAPRLLVVIAAICRLVYLIPLRTHNNPSFELWIPTVCTQVQICLSVVTACIPYMKPFFEGVESGVWRVDDLRRRGLTINDLYGSGYIKSPGPANLKKGDSYTLSSGVKINIGTPTLVHSPTSNYKAGFLSPVTSDKGLISPTPSDRDYMSRAPSSFSVGTLLYGNQTRGHTPIITAQQLAQRDREDSISYESEGSEVRIIPEKKTLHVFPKH